MTRKKFKNGGQALTEVISFSHFQARKITFSSQLPRAKAVFLSWCLKNIWIALSSLHTCGTLYVKDTCVTPPFKSPPTSAHISPGAFHPVRETLK